MHNVWNPWVFLHGCCLDNGNREEEKKDVGPALVALALRGWSQFDEDPPFRCTTTLRKNSVMSYCCRPLQAINDSSYKGLATDGVGYPFPSLSFFFPFACVVERPFFALPSTRCQLHSTTYISCAQCGNTFFLHKHLSPPSFLFLKIVKHVLWKVPRSSHPRSYGP